MSVPKNFLVRTLLAKELNPMRLLRSSIPSLAPLLVLCFWSGKAAASEQFPSELRDVAGMECVPSCTVCHEVDPGVAGTATKDFAVAMYDAGLRPGETDTVQIAYDALPEDLDSDGDGFLDKEELAPTGGELSSDPNNPDSTPGDGPSICTAEILYGCGAQVASGSTSNTGALWALLSLAFGAVVWRFGRRGSL